MWQEAKANDKRIRELMVDHRKRVERRRAYYESRLGDPQQLIRVIGSSTRLYPEAEQFYYHENPENLMPWQANPDIRIDRFDGRSLLDFVPETTVGANLENISRQDREMADELNFERYHDLIEAERLNVTEADRLAKVDEEWTKLLDRHQAKLALIQNDNKSSNNNKGHTFGFDYGTRKVAADEEFAAEEEDDDYDAEKESQLLKEADILQYVDDLTDKDKEILNEMSGKYGIRSYARLLRVAKKNRDEELRSLKKKQREGKPKEGSRSSRRNERRRRRRHRRDDQGDNFRYRRRYSPTYEPYRKGSDESSSSSEDDDEDNNNSDFVIEFGSSAPEEGENKYQRDKEETNTVQRSEAATTTASSSPVVEKKLTPMEKLKLKMRAGLEKSIASNEKDRRQKEREKEVEQLQELAKSQGLPLNAYLRPDPPMRNSNPSSQGTTERYRSPSSEGSVSPKATTLDKTNRSPSPKPRRNYNRERSPSSSSSSSSRHRSRSRNRRRCRSPSPSGSKSTRRRSPSRNRYRSQRHLHSSRDRSSRQRSQSPRSSRKRYARSPSTDDRERNRKYRRSNSRSRSRSRQRERGSNRRR